MRKTPDVIFVIDVNKEDIAVAEAEKLHIPVVALVDTNCDPDKIAYAIPSNDDANRTVKLFVSAVADLVIKARAEYKAKVPSQENRDASHGKNSNGSKVKNGAAGAVAEVEKTDAGDMLSANQEAAAN